MRDLLLYAAQVAAGVMCGLLAAGNMSLKRWPLLATLQMVSLIVAYLSPAPTVWQSAVVRTVFQLHAGCLLVAPRHYLRVGAVVTVWAVVTSAYHAQAAADCVWLLCLAAALCWKRAERTYQIGAFATDWTVSIALWQAAAVLEITLVPTPTTLSMLLRQVGA